MDPLPEDNWRPWTPAELHARLKGRGDDWYIVGGWALDLWHGRQTRTHEDLEFSVPAARSQEYRRALPGLEFFSVSDGALRPLPAAASAPSDCWQLWGADLAAGCWRVDMMLDRGTPAHWVYKRDPALRMPRKAALRTTDCGIPYLAPAIVLLFKAKQAREKDEQDFHLARPRLDRQEKADLRRWLEKLHPGHGWIDRLGSG